MIDLAGIKLRLDVNNTDKDALITEILAETIDTVEARLGVTIGSSSITETRSIESDGKYVMTLPIAELTSVKQTIDGVETDITDNCDYSRTAIVAGTWDYTEMDYGEGYLTVVYETTEQTMTLLSRLVAKVCMWELAKLPAFDNMQFRRSHSEGIGISDSYSTDSEVQDDINRQLGQLVAGAIV